MKNPKTALNQLIDMGCSELDEGRGTLKSYTYWTGGIKLTTKEAVAKAILLKLKILRKDKITKKVEIFDYLTNRFKDQK